VGSFFTATIETAAKIDNRMAGWFTKAEKPASVLELAWLVFRPASSRSPFRMPAPALSPFVGTVGVAIAFKEVFDNPFHYSSSTLSY
jgi:hypothetical protein